MNCSSNNINLSVITLPIWKNAIVLKSSQGNRLLENFRHIFEVIITEPNINNPFL